MGDARWTNLKAADYHADPALSRSQIVDFLTLGVEEFAGRYIHKTVPPKVVDKEAIGEVFHDMILRGKKLDDLCRIVPSTALSKSGSRAGAAWDAFREECESDGVIPMLPKHWDAIKRMELELLANESARKAIERAERREATCEWKDDETGLVCRVMFDVYHPNYRADLKTTKLMLQPHGMAKHIAGMGYHFQAAFYNMAVEAMGGKPGPFQFIFQRVEPRYANRCFTINPEQIAIATAQIRAGMRDIARRLETDNWHDHDHGKVTELRLPRWIESLDQWELTTES